MNAPISNGDQRYCVGDPVATISASLNLRETVDWFTMGSGGTLFLAGNTSYTPTGPGTYTLRREIQLQTVKVLQELQFR